MPPALPPGKDFHTSRAPLPRSPPPGKVSHTSRTPLPCPLPPGKDFHTSRTPPAFYRAAAWAKAAPQTGDIERQHGRSSPPTWARCKSPPAEPENFFGKSWKAPPPPSTSSSASSTSGTFKEKWPWIEASPPENLELLENLEPLAPLELLEEEPPLPPELLENLELLGSPHKKHGPQSRGPCF